MQRLYSMFPQGGPGLGLLLLRISVTAIFLLNTSKHIDTIVTPLLFAAALVIALISISLAIGFLTPFLSIVACATAIANLLISFNSNHLIIHLFSILDAAALALLGPGAFSLDARLFGLRVTVVSPGKDQNLMRNVKTLVSGGWG